VRGTPGEVSARVSQISLPCDRLGTLRLCQSNHFPLVDYKALPSYRALWPRRPSVCHSYRCVVYAGGSVPNTGASTADDVHSLTNFVAQKGAQVASGGWARTLFQKQCTPEIQCACAERSTAASDRRFALQIDRHSWTTAYWYRSRGARWHVGLALEQEHTLGASTWLLFLADSMHYSPSPCQM
jgi:hypothetical protein